MTVKSQHVATHVWYNAVLLLLYRTLRHYCSWKRQMCEELQHMEMLPGIFNEDNDGKCTLLSNTRAQNGVPFDTHRQRQGALTRQMLCVPVYVHTNLFRILLK
jgi:hypothetical protein